MRLRYNSYWRLIKVLILIILEVLYEFHMYYYFNATPTVLILIILEVLYEPIFIVFVNNCFTDVLILIILEVLYE